MKNSTQIQRIIEGCLLGDGHLELRKNSKNASFCYGSSSKQHTEFVHQYFLDYCTDNYSKVKRREFFDVRTEKTYVNYSFRTKALPVFTEQHTRFYIDKIKIIPSDLEINKELLLMWYVGDGELDSAYGYVKLHTNSFTFKEVNFLCNNLSKFEAKPQRKTKTQFLVTIPRRKVKLFLEYIGKSPFSDYNHKWKEVPYINKNIELNGINYYDNVYPLIIDDFLNNNDTIYGLSKKYNVPIKGIKNHFNKNKIEWNPIKNKKKILQFDLNNNQIREWGSGQEIKRTLNYNASAISECCRGLRKQYKNNIWKFK